MRPDVIWLLVGLALIIVELMTGTFYLLILGIAAIVGAIAGYAGGSFIVQVLVAGAAAIAGFIYLRTRRRGMPELKDEILDIGQPVTLDAWISESQRLARIKYRDASWDAFVTGSEHVAPGAILYIVGQEGNRFTVALTKHQS